MWYIRVVAFILLDLVLPLQGDQHEKGRERPASCIPEFLPVPVQSDDTGSSTHSVTPSSISSEEVPLNPVSQLHELLMKELNTLPVYAERVRAVGKYTEYECVVSGMGLSAKGRHPLSPCRALAGHLTVDLEIFVV